MTRWPWGRQSDHASDDPRPPSTIPTIYHVTDPRRVEAFDGDVEPEPEHVVGPPWVARRTPRPGYVSPGDRRGQALVEAALVMPLLIAIFLGAGEMAFLFSDQAHQARETQVVADVAADGQPWPPVAAVVLPGCTVDVTGPDAYGLWHAGATCQFSPRITSNVWTGLPISTGADAYAPSPTPSPTPSPSPTPTP